MLAELVHDKYPQLKPHLIGHTKLADIFVLTYGGHAIGYYDPTQDKLQLDGDYLQPFVGG
tara:strand:- start:310 stop:489 length:180 start_codon:yes stop_codon:yes gene_type:complete